MQLILIQKMSSCLFHFKDEVRDAWGNQGAYTINVVLLSSLPYYLIYAMSICWSTDSADDHDS